MEFVCHSSFIKDQRPHSKTLIWVERTQYTAYVLTRIGLFKSHITLQKTIFYGFGWSLTWSLIFYNEVKRRIGEFLNFDKIFAFLKRLNFDFIVYFARKNNNSCVSYRMNGSCPSLPPPILPSPLIKLTIGLTVPSLSKAFREVV